MKIKYLPSWIFIFLVMACQPNERASKLNANTPLEISQKSDLELPKDYCIIKVDSSSFSYQRDRHFSWIINGEQITVDSLTEFKVKTYEGFDTLYFINPGRQTKEMIICDLVKDGRYELTYNLCCSDFNLVNEEVFSGEKGKSKIVEFYLTNPSIKRKLIGGVGLEAAFLKAKKGIALNGDFNRSAMFPNRYQIFVEDFVPWHEDSTMARIIDPITRKEVIAFKELDKKLIDFWYLFTNNDRLKITVGPNDSVSVERLK